MKNLRIPDPCSENWELMSPQEKGRFCSVCNKCVIDFTQKEPQEILQIIEEKPNGSVCGRFFNHQLEKEADPSEQLKNKLIQYFPERFQNTRLGFAMLSAVFFIMGCSQSKDNCEVMTTTGVVAVDLEEDTLNKNYVIGQVKIEDDTIAKLPGNDSISIGKVKIK